MRISVVIPVYNSGAFLRDCIDSLLAQTEPDCEFIFVNDGSTDDSRDIIVSYQQKDERIHIINQENHGVSVARNNGIAAAKGDFLAFVDADDTIAPDMLDTLYKTGVASGAEIIVSNFITEQDGHDIVSKSPFETGKLFAKGDIENRIFPFMLQFDALNSAANKMYRRDLIVKNNVQFPQGQKLGEDAIFNLRAMAKASGVIFTDYAGYRYREVAGSATRNIIEKDYFKTALEVYQYDHQAIIGSAISPEKIKELKGLRLLDQVVSYGAIYQKPHPGLPASARYRYISKMIGHPVVRELLKSLWPKRIAGQPLFAKLILYCIRYRLTPLLWLAYAYSYHRNKK